MCHGAPKASLKTHRMRDGVLLGRQALSRLSLFHPTDMSNAGCISIYAPSQNSTLRRRRASLFLSFFLSSLFVLSTRRRLADVRGGEAFPFDITYVLTIPRCTGLASRVVSKSVLRIPRMGILLARVCPTNPTTKLTTNYTLSEDSAGILMNS